MDLEEIFYNCTRRVGYMHYTYIQYTYNAMVDLCMALDICDNLCLDFLSVKKILRRIFFLMDFLL